MAKVSPSGMPVPRGPELLTTVRCAIFWSQVTKSLGASGGTHGLSANVRRAAPGHQTDHVVTVGVRHVLRDRIGTVRLDERPAHQLRDVCDSDTVERRGDTH